MRLSTSPIPSPFSFQLERASDRRWIFSVLMSPGATDNMDSDLSASLGHHCGTKSLLLSGLPHWYCVQKETQNALVLILLCHVHFLIFCLYFLFAFLPCILFYLFLYCKALWSIVERRYSKHCLCYVMLWCGRFYMLAGRAGEIVSRRETPSQCGRVGSPGNTDYTCFKYY